MKNSLHTTHCSLLITRCSLFIVHCSLPALIAFVVVQDGNAQLPPAQSRQTLYKLEQGKVSHTTDGGSKWKESVPLSEEVSFVVWNHSMPEHVIAVGKDAVYISFRSGREWMAPWQLPPSFVPTAVAISRSNSNIVYLTGTVKMGDGSRRSAAWVSKNKGMRWHDMHVAETALAALADSSKFWFGVPNTTTEHLEKHQ